jgi:hypothetical protein
MPEIIGVLPELFVGIFLGGLTWAFKNWANTIERSSDRIISKLETLANAFHEHRLRTENRMTKVEAEIVALEKRMSVLCRVNSKVETSQIEKSQ